MLTRLWIQNYALIDELEIGFSGNMNVITGETGAGKSIIIGALGLILGERADNAVLVNKEKKCIVEGIFAAEKKKTVAFFLKDNELDEADELVLRREIAPNGKSRAFINDTPVTLGQLKELSSLLVDLHQQFDTLELTKNDFQREVLDALAGHAAVLDEYQTCFLTWQELKKETEALLSQQKQLERETDYNRFQFDELEEAAFRENELEEIDAELKTLNHAEEIQNVLDKVYYGLQENENPVVQQLKQLSNQLGHFSSYHSGLPELLSRLQSAQIELSDIAADIAQISRQVHRDPEKIEQLNERLSQGYRLLKKHGVGSTAELLAIRNELDRKLQETVSIDELIRQKEEAMKKVRDQASGLAQKLREGRSRAIKPLEDNVNKLLTRVGMPNAKLKVQLNDDSTLNLYGQDIIRFLFDANLPPGQAEKKGQYQPLSKVASGGELSRLMLCIKSLVARSMNLPTLIFDEIDTGISGEAARQAGIIMKELASSRQVISITHQPQIAGKADSHFFVYKEIIKDRVKTNIRLLNTDERITIIAKMLSGEKPTAAAIENAREMVMN